MSLLSSIRSVWSGYMDFQDGGFPYVAFVISNDLDEMRESEWEKQRCTEEMADIAICAIRSIDELGTEEPADVIERRLNSRMDGNQREIIQKYQAYFAEESEGRSQ